MPNLQQQGKIQIEIIEQMFKKLNIDIENISVITDPDALTVYLDVTGIDLREDYDMVNICATVYDENNSIIGTSEEIIMMDEFLGFQTIELFMMLNPKQVQKVRLYPKI